MSTPLPTHEVVAVFPAEIKAGVVRLPVLMHGSRQAIACSPAVARGIAESLRDAGITATPPPTAVVDERPAAVLPARSYSGRRGPAASRDYWRRMRLLRVEYDNAPRCTGSLRALAERHGVKYNSVWTAFNQIRQGTAPFPEEEPEALRQPILKPNGKTIL